MFVSKDGLMVFFNGRSAREKKMLLVLAVGFVLAMDYWIVLAPVTRVMGRAWPELSALKQEAGSLKEDQKNKPVIEKNWEQFKQKVEMLEKSFMGADQTPALLQNLSKEAQDAGVKIVSLKPAQATVVKGAESYVRVSIQIDALAGAHELGFFLEQLENSEIFFRVNDLKINSTAGETKRHSVMLLIEALQKNR